MDRLVGGRRWKKRRDQRKIKKGELIEKNNYNKNERDKWDRWIDKEEENGWT